MIEILLKNIYTINNNMEIKYMPKDIKNYIYFGFISKKYCKYCKRNIYLKNDIFCSKKCYIMSVYISIINLIILYITQIFYTFLFGGGIFFTIYSWHSFLNNINQQFKIFFFEDQGEWWI